MRLLLLGIEPRAVALQHGFELAEKPEGKRVDDPESGAGAPGKQVAAVLARVQPGRTLRMHLRSGRKLEGQYERSQDGMLILADPAMTPVAHSDVDRLWLQFVSKKPGVLTGGVIGAIAGPVYLFYGIGLGYQPNAGTGDIVTIGVLAAVVGGLAGAFLGTLMGSGKHRVVRDFPRRSFHPNTLAVPHLSRKPSPGSIAVKESAGRAGRADPSCGVEQRSGESGDLHHDLDLDRNIERQFVGTYSALGDVLHQALPGAVHTALC